MSETLQYMQTAEVLRFDKFDNFKYFRDKLTVEKYN